VTAGTVGPPLARSVERAVPVARAGMAASPSPAADPAETGVKEAITRCLMAAAGRAPGEAAEATAAEKGEKGAKKAMTPFSTRTTPAKTVHLAPGALARTGCKSVRP
jgi:hypothetical protein